MSIEWIAILTEGLKKVLIEVIPGWISDRFTYRLELSVQLRNQSVVRRDGTVDGPVVLIFVTIRNAGSKPEFIHQCGLDGTYRGSSSSVISQWSRPLKLEERTLHVCELRLTPEFDSKIKSVWVENALKKRWFLRNKELAQLNEQLEHVYERNKESVR